LLQPLATKGKPTHQQNISNITTTMIEQQYITYNINEGKGKAIPVTGREGP
jgi:hypothetical protein